MIFKVSLQKEKLINILFVCIVLLVNGRSPSLIYLLLLCFNVLLLFFFSVMFSLFGLFAGQMRRSLQNASNDIIFSVFIAIRCWC